MKISAESYGHAVMLVLNGELTEDTLGPLETAVDHQLEGKEVVDVILNMEAVPFIDSAALSYLLDLQERLAGTFGQVRLAKCDENVRKILEITDLVSSFETYDEIAEAVRAVQA